VVVVLVVVLVVVEVTVTVVVVVDVVVTTVVVVSEVDVVVGSEVEVVVTIVVSVVALDVVTEDVLELLDVDVVLPSTVVDVELLLVELLVVVDELVLVVVPGTGSGASMAPTSQSAVRSPSPSSGRPTPRWSTDGLGHCAAASIAGLAGRSACAKVPSPASASGASCGFVPG
jgi:hypothetical protein